MLPGSEVSFTLEAGKIVISKVASGIKTDRRAQLRAAAAKVRKSMSAEFRQLSADAVMAFLRADTPPKVAQREAEGVFREVSSSPS